MHIQVYNAQKTPWEFIHADRTGHGPLASRWFYGAALLALLYRLLHFFGPLDEPQIFRQSETAAIAWDFYRHGIHLLTPSVCWLGSHRTLILEFPLPEALTAIAYHLFGPHLWIARLISLAFFIGSAVFLHRIVKYLHGSDLARLTTFIYLVLPLGLFYSRAIHIDFCAMFFALAMLDGALRAIAERRLVPALWGTAAGIMAFLIKAPYAFFLILPLLGFVISRARYRAALVYGPLSILPLAAFILWRHHVETVNARAPDLSFLPKYFRFTDMGWWYFGTLAQRLDYHNWAIIFERLVRECCTVIGFPILLLGIMGRLPHGQRSVFFHLWLIGAFVSMVIFFNLSLYHNYYQIPFLPVTAFFIANGTGAVARFATTVFPHRGRFPGLIVLGIVIGLVFNALWTSERRYYWIDTVRLEAGQLIERNTPEAALIITSLPQVTAVDPVVLAQAHRLGWSVNIEGLNPSIVEKLKVEKAAYLAVLTDKPLKPELSDYLRQSPCVQFKLHDQPWQLHLFDLRLEAGDCRSFKPQAQGCRCLQPPA